MISVPVGYVTDLASVPRILWSVFPPHGRYAKATIIHNCCTTAYFHERRSLNNFHRDRVITFEQIAE
ncbi:DUF1353 domain-containing protein [Escherichia coli]